MSDNVAKAISFLACLVLAVGVSQSSTGSEAGVLEMRAQERPVMKIIRLLQDMKEELEKEKADDDAVNENLVCWCKDNDIEKSKAIREAEALMADLQSAMTEYQAKIEELRQKIAETKQEIIDLQKALDDAVALRMQEAKAFHEEETDLLAMIQALSQAILVLSKHQPDFVQLRAVASKIVAFQNMPIAKDVLSPDRMAALKAFMQESQEASSSQSSLRNNRKPFFKSYTSESGKIYGTLETMKDEFERDLLRAQADENAKKQAYEELKSAKTEQLVAAKKSLRSMETADASYREKNAQAYQEFLDTQAQHKLDSEFLANLRKKCTAHDEEYAARTKSRLEELAAVEETIGILNDDASFETFEKSFKSDVFGASYQDHAGNFLQVSTSTSRDAEVRRRVVQALKKTSNPKFSFLIVSAKIDAFTKVKMYIDRMISELQRQQGQEVEFRDTCISDMHENQANTAASEDTKANLEAKIADLTATIEQQTKDIEAKTKEKAEINAEMKKASETREAANADFQEEATNQQITQAILRKAIKRMNDVYSEYKPPPAFLAQPGAPHIQTSATHTDPGNGPSRFNKYELNAGGDKVIEMLEKVLGESEKMEDEVMRDERNDQAEYVEFMQDSNNAVKNLNTGISDLTTSKAENSEALGTAKSDFKDTMTRLEGLDGELGALKKDCDYTLKNFDARQQARQMEIDALGEAKAYLSGMS